MGGGGLSAEDIFLLTPELLKLYLVNHKRQIQVNNDKVSNVHHSSFVVGGGVLSDEPPALRLRNRATVIAGDVTGACCF